MEAVQREIAALVGMRAAQLRARYAELFGEQPRTGNCDWLRKRIAWRIQALAEGGLSERARRRAEELADDADLRTTVPAGHPIHRMVSPAAETTETAEREEARETATPTPAQIGPRLHQPTAVEAAPLVAQPKDDRLPPTGTVLTKTFKGRVLKVTVLADGFEFEGQRFASLSALAKQITGSHCNGYAFFGLTKKGAK